MGAKRPESLVKLKNLKSDKLQYKRGGGEGKSKDFFICHKHIQIKNKHLADCLKLTFLCMHFIVIPVVMFAILSDHEKFRFQAKLGSEACII